MILQQIIALLHHLDKHLAVFIHTKMRLYRLACYIVGRSQRAYIGRTVIPYQTMTVAYTAVESEFIRTKLFVNELYKLCGFFCRYIIGTVVEYCLIIVNGSSDSVTRFVLKETSVGFISMPILPASKGLLPE